MNANELIDKLSANPTSPLDLAATSAAALPIILRALRLLAAAEANDGSTPETDTAVYDLGYRDESGMLIKQDAIPIDFAQGMERQRNALAARVAELEPDAERYRWLRVQRHADIAACWYLPVLPQDYPVDTPEQRDIAIEAARSAP